MPLIIHALLQNQLLSLCPSTPFPSLSLLFLALFVLSFLSLAPSHV